MLSISFVELKSKGERNTAPRFNNYGHSMSFMVSSTSAVQAKTSAKDITRDITNGTYGVRAKYVIYYLYDCSNDEDSKFFIKECGGELHNMTSGRMAIITYFDSLMMRTWKDLDLEDMVKYDPDGSEWDSRDLICELQNHYKVKNLPAIVIAKINEVGTEEYCIKEIKTDNKDIMFNTFKSIINSILLNYDDFDAVKEKICVKKGATGKGKNFIKDNTAVFLKNLRNEKKRKTGENMTRDRLAYGIGKDTKTVFNNLGKLKRDWCFNIAIQYGLKIAQLNKLLALNGHKPIDDLDGGREEIIADCLLEGRDIYYTDNLLKSKNHKGIIEDKKE